MLKNVIYFLEIFTIVMYLKLFENYIVKCHEFV